MAGRHSSTAGTPLENQREILLLRRRKKTTVHDWSPYGSEPIRDREGVLWSYSEFEISENSVTIFYWEVR